MRSRWFEYKNKAISLRREGSSIRSIEKTLGIPRSTLSGWFRSVTLTSKQKDVLKNLQNQALKIGREKALEWHNSQKDIRIKCAENEADGVMEKIDIANKSTLELALAMLYLGEGHKKSTTCLGNSNPIILNFFLSSLEILYNIPRAGIKCNLHLRADQDIKKIKKYWSRQLKIPISNFLGTSFDARTKNKKTFRNYKGVCVINVGRVAIQRKLVYLSGKYCLKVMGG